MTPNPHSQPVPGATLILMAVVVAALYFAQEILIPFALAFLLSFLLAPFVRRLERWLGRIASVLLMVALALGFCGGIGWIVSSQLLELAGKLPEYSGNIQKKLQFFQPIRGGTFNNLFEALSRIEQNMAQDSKAPPEIGASTESPIKAPSSGNALAIPVRITENPEHTVVNFLGSLLGPLLGPLGTGLVVLLYLVFMLIQREALTDRLIRLIGVDRMGATTQGLDDASSRVSRFLISQLAANTTFGICVTIGLFFIGVPNPMLWGLMVAVLRFVPYVGLWLAASMPIALSFAVFDTWTGPLMTFGLYAGIDLLFGSALEPWLFGTRTGVWSLAIVLSAVFWGWLWGPVGLILATPLTVCLAVLGRHVPQLEFLSVVLSNESALLPDAQVYQSLLAMDADSAAEVAETYLKHNELIRLYDAVLIPALSMEARDYNRGTIDEEKQDFILESLREMIEEEGPPVAPPQLPEPLPPPFVCLPARMEEEELVGRMLVRLVRLTGLRASMVSVERLASDMLGLVEKEAAGAVCISVLRSQSLPRARYLCKKLRQQFPDLKILVGLWGAKEPLNKVKARLVSAGASEVVLSLSEAQARLG